MKRAISLATSILLMASPAFALTTLHPSGGNDAPQIAAAAAVDEVYLSAGTWTLNSTVFLSRPSKITGAGKALTNISLNCPTAFQIAVGRTSGQQTTESACQLSDFSIFVQSQTGPAILQQSPDVNGGSVLEHITIYNAYIGVEWVDADFSTMRDVTVLGFSKYGIFIQNTLDGDDGDNLIDGCTIDGGGGSGLCIYQISSDGERISNTKMLGGGVGYQHDAGSGATGDLEMTMCSIENQSIAGVMFTSGFSQIGITGCEFQSQFIPIYLIGANKFAITGCTIVSYNSCAAILAFNCVGSITGNSIGGKPISVAGGSVTQLGNN